MVNIYIGDIRNSCDCCLGKIEQNLYKMKSISRDLQQQLYTTKYINFEIFNQNFSNAAEPYSTHNKFKNQ